MRFRAVLSYGLELLDILGLLLRDSTAGRLDMEALRRIGATRRCASERMENRDVGLKL